MSNQKLLVFLNKKNYKVNNLQAIKWIVECCINHPDILEKVRPLKDEDIFMNDVFKELLIQLALSRNNTFTTRVEKLFEGYESDFVCILLLIVYDHIDFDAIINSEYSEMKLMSKLKDDEIITSLVRFAKVNKLIQQKNSTQQPMPL